MNENLRYIKKPIPNNRNIDIIKKETHIALKSKINKSSNSPIDEVDHVVKVDPTIGNRIFESMKRYELKEKGEPPTMSTTPQSTTHSQVTIEDLVAKCGNDPLQPEYQKPVKHAKIVVFDGPDGSGKSTTIRFAIEYFERVHGLRCLKLNDPSDESGLLLDIRQLLKNVPEKDMDKYRSPFTEACLFAASRNHMVHHLLEPNLHKYDIIFIDRFYYSTLVYQGIVPILMGQCGPMMTYRELWNLCLNSANGIVPDITFFLDVSPNISIHRKNKRMSNDTSAKPNDVFDEASLQFMEAVRTGYFATYKQMFRSKHNIHVFNGSALLTELVNDICCIIKVALNVHTLGDTFFRDMSQTTVNLNDYKCHSAVAKYLRMEQ